MGNPVLERLYAQRSEQEEFISQLLDKANEEERDLVDAELKNVESARQRMSEIDAQLKPLEDFEKTRAEHQVHKPAAQARQRRGDGEQRRLSIEPREQAYKTPGQFITDYIRAVGYAGAQVAPSPDAQQRVSAALGRDVMALQRAVNDVEAGEHQTTADTPGLLPSPIVGEILQDLDGARPFVSSIGAKPLAGIAGKSFERPHITGHTKTAEQTNEKGELISSALKIEGVPFTKHTFGGFVNISRQDIDWTSPSAWDSVISDLQVIYGTDTEDWAAQQFATAVTQSETVAADDLASWVKGLYSAAVKAMTGNGTKRASSLRLVNTIWTSVDMWASLGTLLTMANVTAATNENPGAARVSGFEGSILDIPRIMVPGLPAGTVILGRSNLAEFYEERIGLLQAVEPKVFGIGVSYGGYAATGVLDPTAFCKMSVAAGGGA
jgi:hypothetical protein